MTQNADFTILKIRIEPISNDCARAITDSAREVMRQWEAKFLLRSSMCFRAVMKAIEEAGNKGINEVQKELTLHYENRPLPPTEEISNIIKHLSSITDYWTNQVRPLLYPFEKDNKTFMDQFTMLQTRLRQRVEQKTRVALADLLAQSNIAARSGEYQLQAKSEGNVSHTQGDSSTFMQKNNYRVIILKGIEHNLTSQQASIVEYLHQAHLAGDGWVRFERILDHLSRSNGKMRDFFKSRRLAYSALIEAGEGEWRGYYRLKV